MIGRRNGRARFGRILLLGAAGALVQYFADPDQGARRRNVARDRFLAFFRRRAGEASRQARYAAGAAGGAVQEVRSKATADKPRERLDDVTLARKVETEIFRDAEVPKGDISVNAVEGVVWLRGEARTPEMINDLVSQAEKVAEVSKVENLLHLPNTPAPTRTDTPESQRREGASTDALGPEDPVTATPVTEERRHPEGAEPSPFETAAGGGGRRPAPLGSDDEGEGGSGPS